MENASKALLIAGSVLLTLIVVAIFMYFYTSLQEFPEQQQEAIEQEQIAKFNRVYESYNKQKMYGVDVVTVMNKVISNNERYADKISGRYLLEENNYFIDVEVVLKKAVKSYATQYMEVNDMTYIDENNKAVMTETYDSGSITGYVNGNKDDKKSFQLGPVKLGFSGSTTKFNLLKEGSFEYFMNTEVKEFFAGDEIYKIQTTSNPYPADKFDKFNYTFVYSGFTDFKRKLFRCTGIEYNVETSRVSKICFEEIPEDER